MRLRGDGGEGAINYVAVILLVAVVVAAITVVAIPQKVTGGIAAAVCRVTGERCDPESTPGGQGTPTASAPATPSGSPSESPSPGDPGQEGAPPPGLEAPELNTDPAYQQAQQNLVGGETEYANANADWGKIGQELLTFLQDLVGFTDAKKCITEGDIMACLMTLVSALPWGKIFKVLKKIPDAARLIKRFIQLLDRVGTARGALGRLRSLLREAQDAAAGRVGRCVLKPSSFVPGTQVLLADGRLRPIEDIRVGDRVLAADAGTGRRVPRRVTSLVGSFGVKRLVYITVDLDGRPGGPTAALTSTERHPFWAPNRHDWIDAADLAAGDHLRTADGGRALVVNVSGFVRVQRVYNLSVSDPHTYHVAAAGTSILVHNCQKMASAIGGDSLLTREAQRAGRSVQQSLDRLFEELSKGNMNPGIGTKALEGTDVMYARARDGARLFFRKVGDTIVVVGKADKNNESKVINRLTELYGQ